MILLGKTRLTSVTVAENASELTRYAAAELQKYLALATVEKLPLCSGTAAAGTIRLELVPDGFTSDKFDRICVYADGDTLVLRGENQVSVLYAVYDFL